MKVLVFGDTILDEFCFGSVDRISPEAPIPVMDYKSSSLRLGGAANVAANIKSLLKDDTVKVHYHGWVSPIISSLLTDIDVPVKEINCEDNEILLKTRYVSNKHQILRVDTNKEYKRELKTDWSFLKDYDLIVLSDYDKGTILAHFQSILLCSSCKILIDFKTDKMFWYLEGRETGDKETFARIFLKSNEKESDELQNNENISCYATITTKGAAGYAVNNADFPMKFEQNVSDVVGAGDTFLAGMAVNFLETGLWDPYAMAAFGNLCAVEKVRHFGTVAVKRSDVEKLNEVS